MGEAVTAFGDELIRTGHFRNRWKGDLRQMLRNYIESGGTLELLIEEFKIVAAELSGGGHGECSSSEGQLRTAPSRQPDAGSGQLMREPDRLQIDPAAASALKPTGGANSRLSNSDQDNVAPSIGLPNPEGEASLPLPNQGQRNAASSSGPPSRAGEAMSPAPLAGHRPFAASVREPSAAALKAKEQAQALTFAEILRIRGKLAGTYRFKDLPNVKRLNNYENLIVSGMIDYGRKNRIPDDTVVRLGIPDKELRKIVALAKHAIPSAARLG